MYMYIVSKLYRCLTNTHSQSYDNLFPYAGLKTERYNIQLASLAKIKGTWNRELQSRHISLTLPPWRTLEKVSLKIMRALKLTRSPLFRFIYSTYIKSSPHTQKPLMFLPAKFMRQILRFWVFCSILFGFCHKKFIYFHQNGKIMLILYESTNAISLNLIIWKYRNINSIIYNI